MDTKEIEGRPLFVRVAVNWIWIVPDINCGHLNPLVCNNVEQCWNERMFIPYGGGGEGLGLDESNKVAFTTV